MPRSATSSLMSIICATSLIAIAGCAPPSPEKAEPDSTFAQEARHAKHRTTHHADRPTEETAHEPNHPRPNAAPVTPKESLAGVPAHAVQTLKYIEEHHRAPEGYEGGRVFHNFGGGGEQALPRKDENGKAVTYHEWDVHAKRPGVNRGAERLVTGSDGSAYYTADHYRTFRKVR